METALKGAHEIIAEKISDHPEFRAWIRNFTRKFGMVHSEKKKDADDEKAVYEMYYDYQEMIQKNGTASSFSV